MKKYLIGGTILFILIVVSGCFLLNLKELDDVAEHGPLKSTLIVKQSEQALFDRILAAGLSWDFDHDRFFLSTDQPHRFLNNDMASFYVVNSDLDRILYHKELKTDADLEGIAYIGHNRVAIISEKGTLYYLQEQDDKWEEIRRISVFPKDERHNLASLAFDRAQQMLYTAEKEGKKRLYKIDLDGNVVESFDMQIDGIESTRPVDMAKDYTIAGMTCKENQLFILSEAYSTIFQYDLQSRNVVSVFGIADIHESSGITFRENTVFLVGDFEGYLPPPKFYSILLPKYE